MKIDITPVVRPATDIQLMAMELYNEFERYVALTSDGKEYTVIFSNKALDEFLPNRTVSEFLKNTQQGILDRIAKYQHCVDTNVHPYWTARRELMYDWRNPKVKQVARLFPEDQQERLTNNDFLYLRGTKQYTEDILEMTKDQKRYFQKEIDKLQAISGELTFVKLVRN